MHGVGNNAQLVAALGLKSAQPFLEEKGQPVGLKIRASLPRSELVRKLQKALNGPVKVFGFGPKQTRAIGVVTGAAGSEIYRVADEGIDTFITGEAPHWAAVAAEEARRESPPRWTLRDGSIRRKSARCASVETIQGAMGIYRLSNRVVSGAQASCRLSAKGARSALAWGIRPREMITAATSAESAVQFEWGNPTSYRP